MRVAGTGALFGAMLALLTGPAPAQAVAVKSRPREREGQCHVLQHGEGRDEAQVLEDHPDAQLAGHGR